MKQLALVTTMLIILLPAGGAAQSRSRARLHTYRPPAAAQAEGQSLPIRRVILYSNGVAYFERRGTVTGHAEINLPFKQSQVDDVLKSMVVLDLGQGRIGAVSYNSSAPPSARLSDIPFSIEPGTQENREGGLAGVLRQLQGARVLVSTASRTATGAILTVEERKSQIDANKPPVTIHSLVIASEGGELSSFDLADVRSVKLVDEGARRDISQFADASASARRRDAKTIVVTSDGSGAREMVVSYTVAAPIWKTSYRVVLDASGKPFFQGWAIVDNVSDEDWKGVSLSLVSGTPVSFIQPIQKPLYRYRPVVPIPNDLKLNPQTYEPGEADARGGLAADRFTGSPNEQLKIIGELSTNGTFLSRQVQQLPQNNRNSSELAVNTSPAAPAGATVSDAITSQSVGVEAAATGSEVGDLFEYRIEQPVTVLHDRSALIPILQTRMDGERVSVYNDTVRRDRPMGGMRLVNTSALTLEDGSVTVIDGDAYAGEALMQRFKPGEKRFVSFALDLGTLVTERSTGAREPVSLVRAVNGVLEVHFYQTEKKTYTIINQTDRPRAVYVEHPLRDDWQLTDDTPKPVDKTTRFYRFRVELPPREKFELPVTERHELRETYVLSNLTPADVELFVSRRYIDDAMRGSLEKVLEIKGREAGLDARLASIDKETAEIAQDQARLRENITALKDTAEARQLIARYVAKAGEQETRIEELTKERRSVTADRARLQAELETAVRNLSVDRKP